MFNENKGIADAFRLGFDEGYESPFGCDVGMTYDDDPDSPRSVAYDMGLNHGEASWFNDNNYWKEV
jgi:hypothetical protein